jgi:hypothetical protein
MRETYQAVGIHDRDEGHPPEFEDVHLLLVALSDNVPRIGKTDKGKLLGGPICAERNRRIRPDGEDVCPAAREICIAIPKARQLRAAIRSQETAEERQDHRLAVIIGEPDRATDRIGQLKRGGQLPRMKELRHGQPAGGLSPTPDRTSSR